MRFLFVMDRLDVIDVAADTTLAFMVEAERRGHQVLHCQPLDVGLEQGVPWATASPTKTRFAPKDWFDHGDPVQIKLADCDAVFIRKDPPFDIAYVTLTWICDLARGKTVFVNDPRGIRDANEKLYTLSFADLMPPTIVTRSQKRLRSFMKEVGGTIVIKPLDGNANALLEMMTKFETEWIMAQKYLPESREGDKRILIMGGELLGAITRIPREDELRANLHVGGRPERVELTARDKEICRRLGPALTAAGLHFVGIDVIGSYLTEVNVTSPTGLREVDAIEGVNLGVQVIEWVETSVRELERSRG